MLRTLPCLACSVHPPTHPARTPELKCAPTPPRAMTHGCSQCMRGLAPSAVLLARVPRRAESGSRSAGHDSQQSPVARPWASGDIRIKAGTGKLQGRRGRAEFEAQGSADIERDPTPGPNRSNAPTRAPRASRPAPFPAPCPLALLTSISRYRCASPLRLQLLGPPLELSRSLHAGASAALPLLSPFAPRGRAAPTPHAPALFHNAPPPTPLPYRARTVSDCSATSTNGEVVAYGSRRRGPTRSHLRARTRVSSVRPDCVRAKSRRTQPPCTPSVHREIRSRRNTEPMCARAAHRAARVRGLEVRRAEGRRIVTLAVAVARHRGSRRSSATCGPGAAVRESATPRAARTCPGPRARAPRRCYAARCIANPHRRKGGDLRLCARGARLSASA
ncbi:hypothetical protein DFH06DRAFT_1419862 [Mycena polygramma]|nr:hypothetical protein DFH06DRAFT_1419862 [Mycena polygramma]